MYKPNAYFPAKPFEASPAFLAWLDMQRGGYNPGAMAVGEMMTTYQAWQRTKKRAPRKPQRSKGGKMQTGIQLANEGAKRAADHADRVHGDFTEKALAAFRAYAWANKDITTEAVRAAYAAIVPTAPDNRAWGAVARKAVRSGVCKTVGMARSKSPNCHGTWVSVYESLILHGDGGGK